MKILFFALSSLFSIAFMFLLTKFIGNRQMSQLSMFDYINGITIGSIASSLAVSGFEDWVGPVIGMGIYAVVSVVISVAANKSITLRKFFIGQPLILLENDKIYEKNLMRARLDINEFLTYSRNEGYFDISDIETAVMEANGKISFLPKSGARPATPEDLGMTPAPEGAVFNIIIDGEVMYNCLKSSGNNEEWLRKQLEELGMTAEEVLLATCDRDNRFTAYKLTHQKLDRAIFI